MRRTDDLLKMIIAEAAELERLLEAQDPEDPDEETPDEKRQKRVAAFRASNPTFVKTVRDAFEATPASSDAPRRKAGQRLDFGLPENLVGIAPSVGGQTYDHLTKLDPISDARRSYIEAMSAVESAHDAASSPLASFADKRTVARRAICELVLTSQTRDTIGAVLGTGVVTQLQNNAAQPGSVSAISAASFSRELKRAVDRTASNSGKGAGSVIDFASKEAEDLLALLTEAGSSSAAVPDGTLILDTLEELVKGVAGFTASRSFTVEDLLRFRISSNAEDIRALVKKRDKASAALASARESSGIVPGIRRTAAGERTVIRIPKDALPSAKLEPRDIESLTPAEVAIFDLMAETQIEHARAKAKYLVARSQTILSLRGKVEDYYSSRETGDPDKLEKVKLAFDNLQFALDNHGYADLAIQDETAADRAEKAASARAASKLAAKEISAAPALTFTDGNMKALDFVLTKTQSKGDAAAASDVEAVIEEAEAGGVVTKRQLDSVLASVSSIISIPPALAQVVRIFKSLLVETLKDAKDSSFKIVPAVGSTRVGSKERAPDLAAEEEEQVESEEDEEPIVFNDKLESALELIISAQPSNEEIKEFESLIKRAGMVGGTVPVGAIPGDPRRAQQKFVVEQFKKSGGIGKLVADALEERGPDALRTSLDKKTAALGKEVEDSNKARKEAASAGHKVIDELEGTGKFDAARVATGAFIATKAKEKADLDSEIFKRVEAARFGSSEERASRIFLTPANLKRGACQLALDFKNVPSYSVSPYAFPFGTITGTPTLQKKGSTLSRKEYREQLESSLTDVTQKYWNKLGGSIVLGEQIVIPSMMKRMPKRLSLGVCIVENIDHLTFNFSDSAMAGIKRENPSMGSVLTAQKVAGLQVNVIGVTIMCPPGSWRVGSTKSVSRPEEGNEQFLREFNVLTQSLSRNLRNALRSAGLSDSFINANVSYDVNTGELRLRNVAPAFLDPVPSRWTTRLLEGGWPSSITRGRAAEITTSDAVTLRAMVTEDGSYVPASAVQLDPRDLLHPASPFNINRSKSLGGITYKIGDKILKSVGQISITEADRTGLNEIAKTRSDELARRVREAGASGSFVSVTEIDGLPAIKLVVPNESRSSAIDAVEGFTDLFNDFVLADEKQLGKEQKRTEILYALRPELASPRNRIKSFSLGQGNKIAVGDLVYIAPMYDAPSQATTLVMSLGGDRQMGALSSGAANDSSFPPELYGVGKVVRLYMDVTGLTEEDNPFNMEMLLADVTFRGDQVKRGGVRGSVYSPTVTLRGVGAAFLHKFPTNVAYKVAALDPSVPVKADLIANYGRGELLEGTPLKRTFWDKPSPQDEAGKSDAAQLTTAGKLFVGKKCVITSAGPFPGSTGRLAGFVSRAGVPNDVSGDLELQDANAIVDLSGSDLTSRIYREINSLRKKIVGTPVTPAEVRQTFRHIDRDIARRVSGQDIPEIPLPRNVQRVMGTLHGCNAILRAVLDHGPERSVPFHLSATALDRLSRPDDVSDTYVYNDRSMGAPFGRGSHTLETTYAGYETGEIKPATMTGTSLSMKLKEKNAEELAYTALLRQEMTVVDDAVSACVEEINKLIQNASTGPQPADPKTLQAAKALRDELSFSVKGAISAGLNAVRSVGLVDPDPEVKETIKRLKLPDPESRVSNTYDVWDAARRELDSKLDKVDVTFEDPEWVQRVSRVSSNILASLSGILSGAPIPTNATVRVDDSGKIIITLSNPQAVSSPNAIKRWESTQRVIMSRIGEIVARSTLSVDSKGFPREVVDDSDRGQAIRALMSSMMSRFASQSESLDTVPWAARVMAHPPLGDVIDSDEVKDAVRESTGGEGTAPGLMSYSKKLLLASDHPNLGKVEIVMSDDMNSQVRDYVQSVSEFSAEFKQNVSLLVTLLTPPEDDTRSPYASVRKIANEIVAQRKKAQIQSGEELSVTLSNLAALENELLSTKITEIDAEMRETKRQMQTSEIEGELRGILSDLEAKKQALVALQRSGQDVKGTGLELDEAQRRVLSKVIERVRSYKTKFKSSDLLREMNAGVPDAVARNAADFFYGMQIGLGNAKSLASTGKLSVRVAKPGSKDEIRRLRDTMSVAVTNSERNALRDLKTFPVRGEVERIASALSNLEKEADSQEVRQVCVPIPPVEGVNTRALLKLRVNEEVPPALLPAVLPLIKPSSEPESV
jgi:hypothetical protein